ncbi:MAG TPA: hypothetical protein VOB72_05415 [Candidatus Dormibacteraeota bacterium]|nr:hypothetical protein [Candidatus Dormibacteraeota bacterium]
MAVVLLLLQASTWALSALAAIPFALGGERAMLLPAALTAALVACCLLLAAGLAGRRRWARGWTITLEWCCLVGSLLLLVLPIGTPHGLVALLVNLGLPVTLLCVLHGRRGRRAFQRSHWHPAG